MSNETAAIAHHKPWRRASTVAYVGVGLVVLGYLLLPICVMIGDANESAADALADAGIAAILGGAALAGVAATVALVTIRGSRRRVSQLERVLLWTVTTVSGLVFLVLGVALTFVSTIGFSRGRPLRRFGKVLLPEVTDGEGWTCVPIAVEVHVRE